MPFTPPPEWFRPVKTKEQIAAAAEARNRDIQRMMAPLHAREAKRRADVKEMWEGFAVGDCVVLSDEITEEEFGLLMFTDKGEPIELDGIIERFDDKNAIIRILKVLGNKKGRSGLPMVGVLRSVSREQVMRQSEREPQIWIGNQYLEYAQARRNRKDGETRAEHKAKRKFWEED